MDKILEINDVRKFFGRKEILRGINFSVEEGVDYFPIVKWADGAVKRNQSPGRDRSSRWCAIWEVGLRGRFLASATMIVSLNVMKTTLPFGEFPLSRVPGQ